MCIVSYLCGETSMSLFANGDWGFGEQCSASHYPGVRTFRCVCVHIVYVDTYSSLQVLHVAGTILRWATLF